MLVQQMTIKKPVSISGVGLHTGVTTTMTFKPAPEHFGIRFRRVDMDGQPEIPADVDHVVEMKRNTTLGIGDARVHTIEHVLAAVAGLEIDNIIIELDNVEPPIADGSAKPFVDLLRQAELEMQDAPKDFIVIDQLVDYKDDARGVQIVAMPLDDFRISVMIDYNNPALGTQHTGLFSLEKEFAEEFASARTFCFLHEVEMLHDQGLIRGGNLDNAIVIVDRELKQDEIKKLTHKLGIDHSVILGSTGVLNDNTLHYRNEPARHKLLDMVGDLALIGAPLKAQILAARPGHAANVEFARKVRKLHQQKKLVKKYQHEKKSGVVFDVNAIQRILPHRYPFLLVDKIVEFQMDERVVGIKNVTMNEPFFAGHFPGQPVMPGVLIIEAMAQAGGVLLLNGIENPGNKLVFFMSMNNVKFRRPVVPGDQLVMEVKMLHRRTKLITIRGEAFVEGNLVAEGEFTAAIVDREEGKAKTAD
ncbi:MAG: bifunctional UDP-3-O-[3-hydroxymyristoyl] N-acetylglucosamine deacetylase/3-hydroxyacyl-ACP dehydratase [Bacteroidetes bacterium]|nr:bifunctional UDP-3-O-[3-hydroxymyristoyl] N-acetylglucosamine deacetylase/3-hydroxyacyl-ACP dehydratase [Bacteroidota bacterium]